jgi:hypothetical protein
MGTTQSDDEKDQPTNHYYAESMRVAGRDYIEHHAFTSTDAFLELAPEDQIDERSKDNVRLFHRRFGVTVPSRNIRSRAIEMRRKLELADVEMRILQRPGHLKLTPSDVDFSPSMGITRYGQVLFLAIAAIFLWMTWQLQFGHYSEQKKLLGWGVYLLFWMPSAWLIDYWYFAAARILARIEPMLS